MTDKLRAAAEMALEALEDAQEAYGNTSEWFRDRVEALRQALAEPDTGTDRGAWADVPDATKWVDELRGDDDEPPNCTTNIVESEPVAWLYKNGFKFNWEIEPTDDKVLPLYTAPPKREWAGLTNEEIADVMQGSVEGINMLPYQFARAIEAKLKEKNCG